ncbi:MAG: D-lyxose/D-mannose family sugar isomerase [Candidatus Lokiarchaeota archaeon]|nr:D-lyxose/D-mannose family sugar isomerase [Candidatus Lokiarchaeota archaeon]
MQDIFKWDLGWDITDYGSKDFHKIGLIHFTIVIRESHFL